MSAKLDPHGRLVTVVENRSDGDGAVQYEIAPDLQSLGGGSDRGVEAFRRIAGELVREHLAEGRRGLALCGASAGAGVTFSAVSLAAVMARIDVRTLLIDADLRAPSLHRYIKPSELNGGLRQVLTGELNFEAAIHTISPNLSLLYAGGACMDGSELLSAPQAEHVFERCMRDFDCVLADTPPSNRSADALSVAAALGYAVIVARKAHSYVEDAALLSRQLKDVRVQVVGTIFNGG